MLARNNSDGKYGVTCRCKCAIKRGRRNRSHRRRIEPGEVAWGQRTRMGGVGLVWQLTSL